MEKIILVKDCIIDIMPIDAVNRMKSNSKLP